MKRTQSKTTRRKWLRGLAQSTPLLALGLLGCASAAMPTSRASPPAAPASLASPAPQPAAAPTARNHLEIAADAGVAYDDKQYPRCASLYEQAAAEAPGNAGGLHLYNAACCHALAGDKDSAFAALDKSLLIDIFRPGQLEQDTDLTSLRSDPRWSALLAADKERRERHIATLHQELFHIYEEDQKDRLPGPDGVDWSKVRPRDEARRKRVLEILARDEAKQSDDYYHAAMIFQHGNTVEVIEQAHKLALRAVEIDDKNDRAKWLAAATKDRALMRQDKPQLYGTQFRKVDGVWILHPVDPSVTEEERARWNVLPLWHSKRYADKLNKKN